MDQRDMRMDFAAFAVLASRHVVAPAGPVTGNLTRFEYNVYSQNGEDGVLAEIFRRIGPGGKRFIEIGAEPWQSNAIALIDLLGWGGAFIEAVPDRVAAFRDKYAGFRSVEAIEAMVTPDWVRAFDATGPVDLDLLSIDVDGNDFWIWAAFERMRPKVVLIEYNSHPGPDRAVVQPESAEYVDWHWDFFGASVSALKTLGSLKGYTLVHTESHGVNAFFVRDDLLWAFADLDLDALPLRAPNFDGRGRRHGPDQSGRSYLEIDRDEVTKALARSPRRLSAPGVRMLATDGADAMSPGDGWLLGPDADGGGRWVPATGMDPSPREAGVDHALRSLVRPGMNVLETGAGYGRWTPLLASLAGGAGRVLALESNADLLMGLEANIALLGASNTEILPLGISGAISDEAARDGVELPVDQLVSADARLHVALVDAGGREDRVITGMAGLIGRHGTTVIAAFDPVAMGVPDAASALATYRSLGLDIALPGEDISRLLAAGDPAGAWLLSPALSAAHDMTLIDLVVSTGPVSLILRPMPGGFRNA